MSRRNTICPTKILTAGDMSGNLVSAVQKIAPVDSVNIQAVWTGTPTGTFSVEASHDQVNWTPLAFANPFTASGAAGNLSADVTTKAPYLRVGYARTSGSGSLEVSICGSTGGA